MFITVERHERVLAKAIEDTRKEQEKEIEQLKTDKRELRAAHQKEVDRLHEQFVRERDDKAREVTIKMEAKDTELARVKRDAKIELGQKEAELKTQILEATLKIKDELSEVRAARDVAIGKAAILEKAFENMGYDVKNMGTVLTKLIDGLSSKNTVQFLSPNAGKEN